MRLRFAFALLLLAPVCHAQTEEETSKALEVLMEALNDGASDTVEVTWNNDLSDPKISQLFEAFAVDMETRMNERDFTAFDEYFSKDTLVARTLIPGSTPTHFMFNAAFRVGFKNNLDFATLFDESFPDDLLYSHLKTEQRDGKVHAIFRMYSGSGLNYHDFEMACDGEQVYILDMLPYATGENMSRSFQGAYVSGLIESGVDIDAIDGHHMNSKDIVVFNQMQEAMGVGKYKKAYKESQKLSPGAKGMPVVQAVVGQVLAEVDLDAYLEHLNTISLQADHSGAVLLHSLDVLAVNERFDEMMENIETLNNLVGGDPMLNIYRGYAYMGQGELTACLEHFLDVVQAYPDSPYGYDAVVMGHILLWDLDGAMDVVETMHKKLGMSKESLRTRFRDYPDLLKTNRFRML